MTSEGRDLLDMVVENKNKNRYVIAYIVTMPSTRRKVGTHCICVLALRDEILINSFVSLVGLV